MWGSANYHLLHPFVLSFPFLRFSILLIIHPVGRNISSWKRSIFRENSWYERIRNLQFSVLNFGYCNFYVIQYDTWLVLATTNESVLFSLGRKGEISHHKITLFSSGLLARLNLPPRRLVIWPPLRYTIFESVIANQSSDFKERDTSHR